MVTAGVELQVVINEAESSLLPVGEGSKVPVELSRRRQQLPTCFLLSLFVLLNADSRCHAACTEIAHVYECIRSASRPK